MFPTNFVSVAFAKVSAMYFDKKNQLQEPQVCMGSECSENTHPIDMISGGGFVGILNEHTCALVGQTQVPKEGAVCDNTVVSSATVSDSDSVMNDGIGGLVGQAVEKSINSMATVSTIYDFEFNSLVSPIRFADALLKVRSNFGGSPNENLENREVEGMSQNSRAIPEVEFVSKKIKARM